MRSYKWLCPGAQREVLGLPSVGLVPYALCVSVVNSCFPEKRTGDPKVDLGESEKGDPKQML